jgi:flagellar basal-body rod modification protein FlgD
MQIAGIGANDPASLADATQSGALDKASFVELLVQQMKNQDPLEPQGNAEMLAQLAQFSSLEQMEELNANLVGLAVLQQSNALLAQLTSSSALIDKSVRYLDPDTGAERWGKVASVRLEDGVAQLMIDGRGVPLANVIEVGPSPSNESAS